MKYALDTNIFIDGFRNETTHADVLAFLSRALPFIYLSAVVMQELAAGARTQVYSLASAACVIAVLFAAGPLFAELPKAALGAVVFYAASKLVSWGEFRRLARFRKTELVLALAGAIGTVLFGILVGVGIAIALSLLEMAQRLARPHEGVLGRVPGLPGMHDVDDYPDAQEAPDASERKAT